MQAEVTLATFRGVQGNDMVTGFEAGHPRTDFNHHARALVAKDSGKRTLRVIAGKGKGVCMTHACGFDFDQHLPRTWPLKVYLDNFQWLARPEGDSCACFHTLLPPVIAATSLQSNRARFARKFLNPLSPVIKPKCGKLEKMKEADSGA
jgi:hypothetical protein